MVNKKTITLAKVAFSAGKARAWHPTFFDDYFMNPIRLFLPLVVCFVLIVSVFTPETTLAQTAPKYSNEFLNIGAGARAFAMGNASVASVFDESAVYHNPAALIRLNFPVTLGGMHSEHFAGLSSYDFGVLAFKATPNTALGISLIRLAVDNIPNTTQLLDNNGNLRFDRITAFSAADYAVNLSFARKLSLPGFCVGANAKIIRRVAGDFARATGFGLDAGITYELKSWQFALMARDVSTTFNSWTFNLENLEKVFLLTGNVLPESSTEITLPQFILGAAYNFDFAYGLNLLAEINFAITTDGKRNVLVKTNLLSIDPRLGMEFSYKKLLFIRTGINNIQTQYKADKSEYTTVQPNMGMGISLRRFHFDYAFTNIGSVSGVAYSHIFSLALSIEPPKQARRK